METKDGHKKEDANRVDSVPSPRPQGGSAQWDRFEVALSKPSGRQKLGMVLKHAQVDTLQY